jgi:hypothetical protein
VMLIASSIAAINLIMKHQNNKSKLVSMIRR